MIARRFRVPKSSEHRISFPGVAQLESKAKTTKCCFHRSDVSRCEQSECGLTAGSYATQKQTGSAPVSGTEIWQAYNIISRRSEGGIAPVSGTGDRGFESRRFDQKKDRF